MFKDEKYKKFHGRDVIIGCRVNTRFYFIYNGFKPNKLSFNFILN